MLEARQLSMVFQEGEQSHKILDGLDLALRPAQKIGIVGASGVGKSTLLHILGGLQPPTSGNILVAGRDLYQMDDQERAVSRNRTFGFVFQFYHLLPELTALENVCLPAWLGGCSKKEAAGLAKEALEKVGLKERESFYPGRLSGGEQQRVALARALIVKPKVILADEPTGNLDQETGRQVMAYLTDVAGQSGASLILVTHNRELTRSMDQVFELRNGTLRTI